MVRTIWVESPIFHASGPTPTQNEGTGEQSERKVAASCAQRVEKMSAASTDVGGLGVGYTGVRLEIEAGNHLQVLELLGIMAIADDIVHLEGTGTGLTLWFSGPRQAGTFVASCCSEAHPFGSASLWMLQPLSQYVALRPDDILAV